MRDLPERKINGKAIEPVLKESYSQVIFQFLADPTDVENNKNLKTMECSLQLTLNFEMINSSPTGNIKLNKIEENSRNVLDDIVEEMADELEIV